MSEEIVWDVCNPAWKKNFVCKLNNKGRWDRGAYKKNEPEYGKWVFTINQIDPKINAPTFADQRNFFTGLIETEWRNDNFVFKDGNSRNIQKDKKLKMFQEFFDDARKRFNEGIPNGIDFYIKLYENKEKELNESKN